MEAAPFSLQWSQKNVALSLDSADARIGRPLTPLSVAGVHRRAYRRAHRSAVYGGAAAYGVGSYYGYGYPASSGYYAPQSYPSYYAPQTYSGYYAPQSLQIAHAPLPQLLRTTDILRLLRTAVTTDCPCTPAGGVERGQGAGASAGRRRCRTVAAGCTETIDGRSKGGIRTLKAPPLRRRGELRGVVRLRRCYAALQSRPRRSR